MARLSVSALMVVAFIFTACGEGVVREGSWRDTEESISFNALAGNSGWRIDDSAPPQGGEDNTQGPLAPPPTDKAKSMLELHMGTVSRCHASEYDHILKTLKAFTNPGTGKYDKKFIVTLETNEVALGHSVIETETLKSQQQDQRQNLVQRFTYPMEVTIPANLANSEFTAYLFACIDLDDDKSCTDEATGSLQGFDFKTDVVFFVPVKVTATADKVSFRALEPGEAADDPNVGSAEAAKIMQSLLKNLHGKDFGKDAQGNPLDIILTVTADKACPPPPPAAPPRNRTNGCFVAGTKVDLGNGKLVAVEQLFAGTTLTTAHGEKATTIKWVSGKEKHKVVEITTEGGHKLTVTRFHPMKTLDGMKLAKDLTEADALFNAYWEPVRITSLSRRAYSGLVYNFELPGIATQDHLLVAGGLVTGDLHLQREMSANLK